MIWLGTVVLKPGPCAKITWTARLAMAATRSHRSALPFNDLRSCSNPTHLSCSPWRCGLLHGFCLAKPEALLKAGQVCFAVAGHGTSAPDGKFAGGSA